MRITCAALTNDFSKERQQFLFNNYFTLYRHTFLFCHANNYFILNSNVRDDIFDSFHTILSFSTIIKITSLVSSSTIKQWKIVKKISKTVNQLPVKKLPVKIYHVENDLRKKIGTTIKKIFYQLIYVS